MTLEVGDGDEASRHVRKVLDIERVNGVHDAFDVVLVYELPEMLRIRLHVLVIFDFAYLGDDIF